MKDKIKEICTAKKKKRKIHPTLQWEIVQVIECEVYL